MIISDAMYDRLLEAAAAAGSAMTAANARINELERQLAERSAQPVADIPFADLTGSSEEIDLHKKVKAILKHHKILNGVLSADLVAMFLASPPAQPQPERFCTCENTITSDPCIVCGKPKLVTREWAEKMAAKEGDTDATTGKPAPAQEDKP